MSKHGDLMQWIAYSVVTMGAMLFVSGIGGGMNTAADEALLTGIDTKVNSVSQSEKSDKKGITFAEKFMAKALTYGMEH